MKKVKRALALILSSILVLSLVSCGNTKSETGSSAGTSGGEGEPLHFVAAHGSTEDSTLGQFFLAIQQYLDENSDVLKMDLYPAAQLGNDSELAESIVEGSVQMVAGATANYVNVVSDMAVFDLPFAFDSYWQMRNATSDENLIAALNESLAKSGLILGTLRAEGFRVLFSNEPVASYDDIKGLQLRVMDNKYHIALWSDLGANTTTVAFSELYTALQQGVVSAQENTVTATLTNYNLYEVTKYATATKHEATIHPFLINLEWYNSLTEQQQNDLMAACAYAKENEADLDAIDQENLNVLRDEHGYEIYEFSEEDLQKCREATQDVREMVKTDVSPALYDAYIAAIEAAPTEANA